MTVTDEIKNRLDIVDIVSETVKLRRSGKSLSGFCPFHPNTRTPAFVVYPDTGTWRCFGQCNEGGDIFKFIMKRESMDFSQALKYLAERAGVQLKPPTPEMEHLREVGDRLENALEIAGRFYHAQLVSTPAGVPALEYLQKRGITAETLDAFGFGYAPDSWDTLQKHLSARGVDIDSQKEAGLLSEREQGGFYDRFRNRIMIPIRNADGKMAGFGARILNPEDVPKFLNSPQTELFDKGRLLYGLDKARKAIRQLDQAVIVEGYLDVVALHQAGFTNVVSPMGTALTEDQLRMLKKFTRRIVLALDADAAGEKATLRGLEVAREAMDHEAEIGFDVNGLLRQERRLQADIRVTTLPEGMDPDEVVQRDRQEWQQIIDRATPLVIHVMETLVRTGDINDPKVKSGIAAKVVPLIEDVPDPVERDTYRQRLARLLRVSETALAGLQTIKAPAGRSGGRFNRPVQPGQVVRVPHVKQVDPYRDMEKLCLSFLCGQPEMLYRLDRQLRQAGLEKLSAEDFSQSDLQSIFAEVTDSLTQDKVDPLDHIQDRIEAARLDELGKFFELHNRDKISEDDLLNDLLRTVIRLRAVKVKDVLLQLRFLQEDQQGRQAGVTGDAGFEEDVDYRDQVLRYTQSLHKLEQALKIILQKNKF